MAAPWLQWYTTYLRVPDTSSVAADGTVTATFTPPLTAPEQATFADLQLMAKFAISGDITLAEFQTKVKPAMAVSQTFRARTRAQFLALTAAQQAGALYDLAVAHDDVLRALLRS